MNNSADPALRAVARSRVSHRPRLLQPCPIGLTTAEFERSAQEALAAGVMAIVAKDRLEDTLVSLIRYRVK
jgi:hypothetical protein